MISKLDLGIVDTHNFKTLGVLDISTYNPMITVEEAKIEITPPGFKLPAEPFFMIRSLNVFNSNNVGLTKATCEEELVDLPDGLWKIKYSICPNDKLYIEKVFLKTDKLECKFAQAFLKLDLSDCDQDNGKCEFEKLQDVEIYIQGAIASANIKDFKSASTLYKKANTMLDELLSIHGGCNC